jgi:thiol-disulfide isomerase/thioredoxin
MNAMKMINRMTLHLRGFGFAIVAAVALVCAPAGARAQDLGIVVGAKAPGAKVETLDGTPADLATAIAKGPVLLEFWATWCPNCKELEPALKAAFDKHGSTVQFIGVAVSASETSAAVKAFVTKNKLPGTQYYDRHGSATDAYDAPATSYIVLIDKGGKVVYTGLGGEQNLEAAFKKLQ